jgi:hypothetical protein
MTTMLKLTLTVNRDQTFQSNHAKVVTRLEVMGFQPVEHGQYIGLEGLITPGILTDYLANAGRMIEDELHNQKKAKNPLLEGLESIALRLHELRKRGEGRGD